MTSALSHVQVSRKVLAGWQFVRGLPAGRGVRPSPTFSTERHSVRFFFFIVSVRAATSDTDRHWTTEGLRLKEAAISHGDG